MSAQLEVLEDPTVACAELLVEAAAGGGHLVLTGGSTPRAAYERAAEQPQAWSEVKLWWGDERCVPPDDERSNFLMAKQALLDRVVADSSGPTSHRIPGELGPSEGADAYEAELREAGPPEFDLLLLGLGPDGHIASMFPDQPSLSEDSRLVVGVERAGLEPYVPRVTFTFRALALGKRVVMLVSGEEKAGAVAAAFGPDAKPDPHVPASMLSSRTRDLTVLVDSAAAASL
jgi:6-phosphogluconolactonase